MGGADWEVLGESELLDVPGRIRVTSQSLRLPDGRVVENYHQVQLADYVVVYAETPDGRAIFERQYKHGMRRVGLTLPSGLVEPGETPLQAAIRELREETGYACTSLARLGSYVVNGNLRVATAHLFLGSGAERVAEPCSGDLEDMEILLLSRDEARRALQSGEVPLLAHACGLAIALLALAAGGPGLPDPPGAG